jgi:glycosyltransferase involved in cell wall biosynthesis
MKVMLFGSYDLHQQHSITKIAALKEAGFEIIECRTEFPLKKRNNAKSYSFFSIVAALIREKINYIKFTVKFFTAGKADVMLVLYPAQVEMPLAWVLAKLGGRKIIYAPFISVYQTLTEQRKYFKPKSIPGRLFFAIDKFACRAADKIILDTNAHADYFSKTFGIPREKFARVFIGTDESYKKAPAPNNKECTVLFYGSFIPGQGIEVLLGAAEMLKNEKIKFIMAGDGPLKENAMKTAQQKGLKNIGFPGWIDAKDLPSLIAKADVGIGIIESNPKTDLVVANKAYAMLAMGKPLINFDARGIRELAGSNGAVYCNGTTKGFADAILKLKNDSKLRNSVAENGYNAFKEKASVKAISAQLKEVIEQVAQL